MEVHPEVQVFAERWRTEQMKSLLKKKKAAIKLQKFLKKAAMGMVLLPFCLMCGPQPAISDLCFAIFFNIDLHCQTVV